MIARADFVAAVKALVGTPVKHRGRLAGCGLDCVGVPIAALAACGVRLPEPEPYPQIPGAGALEDHLRRHADVVGDEMPGDVLVLLWKGEARHVAIDVGDGLIVHARASMHRVVCEPMSRAHRVAARWRMREVG